MGKRKNAVNVRKQFKGQDFDATMLIGITHYYIDVETYQRDYQDLYSSLQLNYKIIAGSNYLISKDEKACIDYMYLSAISGILSKLFDTAEEKKDRDLTDAKNSVWDFDYALLQLYAISQPFPKCICEMDHIYIKLFQGQFEQVELLLSQLGTQMDENDPYKAYISGLVRNCIQAIMKRDSKSLQEELIKHIKEYRKWPVGYSTFIDIYSIAFMKLAHQYDMSCEIDIIEIPHLFFDAEACKIDKEMVKLPFYEDAIEVLKSRNIEFELL